VLAIVDDRTLVAEGRMYLLILLALSPTLKQYLTCLASHPEAIVRTDTIAGVDYNPALWVLKGKLTVISEFAKTVLEKFKWLLKKGGHTPYDEAVSYRSRAYHF
jgi:hypothetical protein